MGIMTFQILQFYTEHPPQLPPIIEALNRTGMPYVKLSNDLLCEKKNMLEIC